MTRKILRSILLAVTLVLVASFLVSTVVLYSYFGDVQVKQLKGELSLAAAGTEQYGLDYLRDVQEDSFRLTWVDKDGTVLFDSVADEKTMENHLGREEIQQAFATGTGSSVRRTTRPASVKNSLSSNVRFSARPLRGCTARSRPA